MVCPVLGFWHDRSSQVDIGARRGSLRVQSDAVSNVQQLVYF
jgi:hypothetical protein